MNHRLRPEKSQMVARTRGFNSRRLQERSAFALSVVGGGKSPFVAPDDLPGPQQGILRSDARGLRTNPYLEVLGPVVVPDSIAMMDALIRKQGPPEEFLHDEDMFENVAGGASPWMLRETDHEVARLMPSASSPPSTV